MTCADERGASVGIDIGHLAVGVDGRIDLIDRTVQPRQALQQRHAIARARPGCSFVLVVLSRMSFKSLVASGDAILGFEDIDFVIADLDGIRLGGFGFIVGLAGLLEIPLLAIDLRDPQIGLGVGGIVRHQLVVNLQRRRVILRQHQVLRQIALHFAIISADSVSSNWRSDAGGGFEIAHLLVGGRERGQAAGRGDSCRPIA